MKILILCYEYPPIGGGGAKVVHGLAQELSRKNCKVDVVTMNYKNLPSFEKSGNINIYRINCIRLSKNVCTAPEMISYLIFAIPLLLKLSKKNNYLINHTHFIFPDGILALALKIFRGIPYILTAHGSDVPGYNPDRFKFLHKLLFPLWKKVTSSSEKIIVPSRNLEIIIKSINPKLKTAIIPNGIDLNKFSPGIKKKKQILIVTRMFERKGVQYFLKALNGFNHSYAVHIVGEGPYLNSLKEISKELRLNINFWGYIDNNSDQLKKLYEESEIFVFTSESENFPVVLLEAMLSGMAIITTNDNGCAEVVGDSAILIDSKNSEAIKESLQKLMTNTNLKRKFQYSARKRVENNFSWECTAQKHIELYEKTVPALDSISYSEVYVKEAEL